MVADGHTLVGGGVVRRGGRARAGRRRSRRRRRRGGNGGDRLGHHIGRGQRRGGVIGVARPWGVHPADDGGAVEQDPDVDLGGERDLAGGEIDLARRGRATVERIPGDGQLGRARRGAGVGGERAQVEGDGIARGGRGHGGAVRRRGDRRARRRRARCRVERDGRVVEGEDVPRGRRQIGIAGRADSRLHLGREDLLGDRAEVEGERRPVVHRAARVDLPGRLHACRDGQRQRRAGDGRHHRLADDRAAGRGRVPAHGARGADRGLGRRLRRRGSEW